MNDYTGNVQQFLRLIYMWLEDGTYENIADADPEQLRLELFGAFEKDVLGQERLW